MPVSPQCPQEIVPLPLPPPVLQGTAISSECFSQLPPENVAVLRGSLPPKKCLEKPFPAGLPLQGTELGVSMGPVHCRERVQDSVRITSTSIQRGVSHSGGPRAGSGNGTRSSYSLEEVGHRGGPSSRQRVRVLQPILHRSEEGWGVASYSRSEIIELLSHETKFQDAYYQASRVPNQVQGLVCDDRSERCLLPYIHSSSTPEVPKVCFRGQAYQYRILPFGLALSPLTFTKCVDAVLAPL